MPTDSTFYWSWKVYFLKALSFICLRIVYPLQVIFLKGRFYLLKALSFTDRKSQHLKALYLLALKGS
jgi:hypothetical protein